MKKINFYTKSIRGDSKQKQRTLNVIKRDFFYEISKPRKFDGLDIKYSNHYLSKEKCWIKFAAGSNFSNPKQKINLSRAARIHWIFIVIDLFKEKNSLTKKYSNINVNFQYNNDRNLEIEIIDKNYFMYFELYLKKDSNNKSHYVLLTAFYKENKRKTD